MILYLSEEPDLAAVEADMVAKAIESSLSDQER